MSEIGKKSAAFAAVDKYVKNHQKIGIGSGSTIKYAVERLAARVNSDNLQVQCAPTSFQAKLLITEFNLPLISVDQYPELDIAFDGADEVDSQLSLIKGGGGCHLQEKVIASAAQKLIIIADNSKDSKCLGDKWKKGVPIEVLPLSYLIVKRKIEQTLGGLALLREAVSKAGPVVTDSGNFILDWKFDSKGNGDCYDWVHVDHVLHMIPGVIETGIFIGMTTEVFFGNADGTVYTKK